jgi:undecaprenyl pyrophosphate phosphatase UppP
MNTLQAINIAIIEGLTEFLPISHRPHHMGFTAAVGNARK